MGTSRVLLLGDPVAHSLSPAMHSAAFRALGIDAVYEARRVTSAELGAVVQELHREPYLGANVTIPHKEAVFGLIDEWHADVEKIRAVNTLVRERNKLRGANTDVVGFARALDERKIDVEGGRVVVLGAGGAARACVYELAGRNVAAIDIASRNRARAEEIAAEYGSEVSAVEWPPGLEHVLLVNATPLGLHGEDVLPGAPLDPDMAVFDLVPIAGQTPLVRRARAAGCVTIDGLPMLLHQAAASFELWTGRQAPVEAMRSALAAAV